MQLVIDSEVAVYDWTTSGDLYKIRFYADSYQTVTLTGTPPASASDTGTFSWKSYTLASDTYTTVTIKSGGPVSISTERSRERGVGYYIRKDTSILSGPFGQDDVTYAGIGGALGVAIAVLYEAIAAKLAIRQSAEKIA